MRWSDVQSEFYKSLCGEFTAWTDVKMKSLTCEFVEILWEFQARIQCLNWSQIYETLCVDFLNSLLICPDRVLALKFYKSFNGTTNQCLSVCYETLQCDFYCQSADLMFSMDSIRGFTARHWRRNSQLSITHWAG